MSLFIHRQKYALPMYTIQKIGKMSMIAHLQLRISARFPLLFHRVYNR